jgi:hypothetical protein
MNSCWIGQVPRAEWTSGKEVSKFQGQLEVYLAKFQDPAQSDSMSRLQSDLDETKIILVGPEKYIFSDYEGGFSSLFYQASYLCMYGFTTNT